MVDSNHKLTGPEKENASEAADVSHFYKLLFASKRDVIQDDGTETKIIVPASLHPLFAPVLSANKNSKATRLLQEAVEAMSAALAQNTDRYASAANLFPNMFDQPMTAAIRLGQWEWKHTVLNVDGIKTNFALHHLAPPNTNSTVYKQRQQGEIKLVQQEQVGEDKSRFSTKTTDLYHHGRMGTVPEMHTLIGTFFAIMCVIIVCNPAHPPLVWQELAKFDQVMRSPEGRQWSERHHDAREVLFNVIQEL